MLKPRGYSSYCKLRHTIMQIKFSLTRTRGNVLRLLRSHKETRKLERGIRCCKDTYELQNKERTEKGWIWCEVFPVGRTAKVSFELLRKLRSSVPMPRILHVHFSAAHNQCRNTTCPRSRISGNTSSITHTIIQHNII